MLPTQTQAPQAITATTPQASILSLFRHSQSSSAPAMSQLQLNDLIEARNRSFRRKKFSGRIGLKVVKDGNPYLVMPSHVITEAIYTRSILGIEWSDVERLRNDWNDNIEIWSGGAQIGTIEKTFDPAANVYPTGFEHDVTLIKPLDASKVQTITSPVNGLGWLDRKSRASLRQQKSTLKILGATESHRDAKTLRCCHDSDVVIVGEGIFLNQKESLGSKALRNLDRSTCTKLVSRAVLYRVNPDFDPPNGYSGIALYADCTRQDGTQGPGVVGFQSFVQRSGHVQNYNMEGSALEERLKRGRVAFYGAFQVPDELREQYSIV